MLTVDEIAECCENVLKEHTMKDPKGVELVSTVKDYIVEHFWSKTPRKRKLTIAHVAEYARIYHLAFENDDFSEMEDFFETLKEHVSNQEKL